MGMQQTLRIFETENHHQFRTIMRDGEPWFVLADVCSALEIKNASDAATRLDDDEKMTLVLTEGHSGVRGGARSMNVINESGLWSIVLRSDKPEAKRFKKWVTSEVLPSIRKTGGYGGKVPAFIRRANDNWDRVDPGYFSVINEMTVRVWGRFERLGHILADKGPDGRQIRPDVSVGRTFSDWMKKHHPGLASEFGYYIHSTPEWEGEAKQYPLALLPQFIDFLENCWIKEYAAEYLRARDPAALPHLPNLLPGPDKPRPGMVRSPTLKRFNRR